MFLGAWRFAVTKDKEEKKRRVAADESQMFLFFLMDFGRNADCISTLSTINF